MQQDSTTTATRPDEATRTDESARSSQDSPRRLIASDRVEGTPVYNRAGEKLGRVENFMVDKRSGQAEYAVMSFGGLFGLGHDHYPLPWSMLEYDPERGGYVVELDKDKLKNGPRYQPTEEPEYDRDYNRGVYDYYGVIYTW
jgi:hypothetical protein